MKQLALSFLAGLIFLFPACEEVKELLTFNITESQTFTVPAQFIVPGAQLPSVPVTFTTNSEEDFKNNNTRADLVKDVTLSKLVLTIQDPANEDFGFLRDVEIFIDADNADEVRLAYLTEVPANAGKTIELISTNAKLDKYLKAPSFTIRTRASVDEAVSQDVTIRTDMTFKVTADPL